MATSRPASARRPATDLAGRAGADHDDVEAALAHGAQSIPVRPALQGRGILPGCSARPSRSPSSPPRSSRPAARTRTPRTPTRAPTRPRAPTTTPAAPARPRAARRPGAACAWSRSATSQSPLYVTAPPGDRRRIFVVEQAGRIVVVRGGKPLAQPFLDIRSKVDGRRRAGAALDGVRPRLRAVGAASTSTTPRRAAPRRSGSTAAPATTAPTPAARASCCAWTTPSPTTTAA